MSRLRREDGIVLVTALLVSLVVLVLATAAIGLAIHNSEQSGNDRRRVQAIAAAEAGIDYFFSHLQSTGGTQPSCSIAKTLTSSPPSRFTATVTFYDATGATMTCPLPLGVLPTAVLIRSVGRAGPQVPARTMESYAKLSVNKGSTFDNAGAIFGQTSVTMEATTQLGGDLYNDADIYTNGDAFVSANSTLYGKIFAQGAITLSSNAEVKQDVWAGKAIELQAGARVLGDATSSTSSIELRGQARIFGDARAGTTISSGNVDGYRTPNSPSPLPPAREYPAFTYVPSHWRSAGYTVHEYSDCNTPLDDLGNWWGTGAGSSHLIRVTGTCTLNIGSSAAAYGALAIVADGSVVFGTGARLDSAPGTGPWPLYIFAGMAEPAGCEFRAMPHSGAGTGIVTLVYTPPSCDVHLHSNNALARGQIIGGRVAFKHSMSFRFEQLPVPGTGAGGFRQDVVYKREIFTSH